MFGNTFFTPAWLTCLLSCWCDVALSATCPWDERGLVNWDDAKAWDKGKIPGENAEVVIKKGKRVLLNVQPEALATLTIEAGAALIWGDVDGLVLNTHHIIVRGEFHIGSQKCRFLKKATIRLHGKLGDKYYVKEEQFGHKFIGVVPGGTLELHGKKKTSWTKLAQTIRPITDIDCAMIYSHSRSVLSRDKQQGLHVIVWTDSGAVLDYNVVKNYAEFRDQGFFDTIPDGSILGMFAYGKSGLGSRKKGKLNIGDLESVIEGLGGSAITKVEEGGCYSFLGKKGDKSSVKEYTKASGDGYAAPKGFLHLHDTKSKLVFQVSTAPDEVDYFRVLHEDAAYPILTLVDEVEGWEVGDEVFVTSTDFDWTQTETRRLLPCGNSCTARNIRVDDNFRYLHYGNFTMNVDERAEVALLTRNILIEGIMEDSCYYVGTGKRLCDYYQKDTFGAHVLIAKGHKSVHVRGVELFHVGQQSGMGHYPLHFHMCGDVPGMYVRENTVHESYSRCVTVHGTNYLEVSDNVCYKHYGHGIFLEDGVEQDNLIRGNLVAGTLFGTLLLSDMSKLWCSQYEKKFVSNCGDLSSYWITHPRNNITGNVAAGGEGIGFMYVFADLPLGPSREWYKKEGLHHHPKDQPLLAFSRNVAHSNERIGVFMDSKISTGTGMENKGMVTENGILQTENKYDPHVDGKPVWCNMSYGTFYKNGDANMWVKGGNVRVTYTTMADSPEGFSGGTTLFDTGTEVYKSIFIGETDNKGMPERKAIQLSNKDSVDKYFDHSLSGSPLTSLTGVGMYQGPVFLKGNFFDQYVSNTFCADDDDLDECDAERVVTRHAGAISFKRSNNYPTMTSSYVENNTFGFCDNDKGTQHWVFQGRAPEAEDFVWRDGNKAAIFRDRDGALTGTVDAQILPNIPLYKGDECLDRPDWGDMMVCPYRYVKFELLGTTGNLAGQIARNYPLVIQRDDKKYKEQFSIKGEIRNEFLLRTHQSYVIDFNTAHKNGAFPKEYKLFGYGVEKQDVVRIGLCQPKGVDSYEISMDYPAYIDKNATWVDSLKELDADKTGAAFFYDSKNGILFFKLLSFHQDTNDTQQCPDGKCWKVKISRKGGSDKLRSCLGINVPPFVDKTKKPKKPAVPKCPGIATPEGLGAVQWDSVDFVVREEYKVPCLQTLAPKGKNQAYKGCYWEKKSKKQFQPELMDGELVSMSNSMTVDLCVNRCFHRGYKYAALSRGQQCTCGQELNSAAEMKGGAKDCKTECTGNSAQTCGSKKHLDVYSTGI